MSAITSCRQLVRHSRATYSNTHPASLTRIGNRAESACVGGERGWTRLLPLRMHKRKVDAKWQAMGLFNRHWAKATDADGKAADGDDKIAKRRRRVAELKAQGWTNKAIAAELGVSAALIGRDCAQLGITRAKG